jgi:glycosyltransferase involved in cell wall biosynthesis
LKESFCSKLPGIDEKIEIITNGYDEADFSSAPPVTPEVFTISYIGTLSNAYPLNGFIEALGRLHDQGLKIHLRFAGVVSPGQKELIQSKIDNSSVGFRPYVSHSEAVSLMTGSSMLLLIIPDHHSNKSIITGKLFEYLASGKPVLCLGPADGDAAAILWETSHGKCAHYTDTSAICDIIRGYFNSTYRIPAEPPEAYSRLSLTKKLVSLL